MHWLALLSPFLLLLSEAGHAKRLITRQDFDACDSDDLCSGVVVDDLLSPPNSTVCTNVTAQQGAKCLYCAFLAQGDTSEDAMSEAQTELDSYVLSCQTEGFAVQSVNVTSGAGPTSTAASAPSASASTQPDKNGAFITMRWGAARALALGIFGFAVLV
ncbi:hypothetical protein GGX14DRAFT_395663 [Mycena pura]|uniref:Uncharacterized protein n=1 Tax=Mycena pura TaxID=153505 RepID=A0AAD6VFR7_9AGAR|nr:hypothetical protein GGX14DRAFT_395663 [Mycena pura]